MPLSQTMSIGHRLRQERLRLNLSQERLAATIGATAMSISRWEHDRTLPQPHYRELLCRVFNQSADILFSAGEFQIDQELAHMSFWHVPHLPNSYFTGREEELQRIHASFARTHAPSIIVLCGQGGVGKTQLATQYAYRFRKEYHAIFWVRAETRESLIAEFVAIAELLALSKQEVQDQRQLAEAVKHWLKNHSDWLLVFDNVEDVAVMRDILCMGGAGHILLITGLQSTGQFALSIDLEPMEPEEGTLFLLRRARLIERATNFADIPETLRFAAKGIIESMDGLPLALDQAGAYIEETGCSLADYFELYQQRCITLLDRRGGRYPDHPQSVRVTLSLSLRRVEHLNPNAADLLRFCAFLHPAGIPLRAIAVTTIDLGPLLPSTIADQYALNEAIAVLRAASLLHRNADEQTLTIHHLVQAVVKDSMNEDEQRTWAERSVRFVNDACSDIEKMMHWLHDYRSFPHEHISAALLHCVALIDQWHMMFEEAARILYLGGAYFLACRQDKQAEALFRRVQKLQERLGELSFPDIPVLLQHYSLLLATLDPLSAQLSPSQP